MQGGIMQGIDDSGNTPPSDIPRHYNEVPDCAHDSGGWARGCGGRWYCQRCGHSVAYIILDLKNTNVGIVEPRPCIAGKERLVDEDN